ncbi:DNA-directed RNA polymerase III subunit rpc8 isoform X2 [Sorghum bicolor]|uniref:DNA-directed RNA polymerase III subunit rpc8 isoform X2 n=1 Tax=Sorghum bicolor TaxID=4558 RepID=UPI000B4255E5|nr:DNA-directed RNA polymerase III subunit rpc8 isoform X2 [Sorghum bicolor]|eukprot:XP_021308199.1 DNA-directed RNA polymerase III subunit rpc8 isoform X2 [Sorghum bicolor]
MFALSQIEHDLPMPPHLLSRPLPDAIKAELERLFLDKVSFRLLMFKPFNGEVLVGRIIGYDDKGLQVSLDFFSDISIPGHLMQFGTVRGPDGRWMLKTEDGDELYLDLDDEIRFLVSSTKYPRIPIDQKEDDPPFAPMQIVGSIKGDGLGLLAWWAADEEEGEEAAEQEQ